MGEKNNCISGNSTIEENSKRILISHNKNDKVYCEIFIDFLSKLGLTEKEVICTCITGYGIGLNNDIYEWLAKC